MNIKRFDELMALKKRPWQETFEWRSFLEFAETYFRNRGVKRPVVVELGIAKNRQKRFYEELLGARHIGIDIDGRQGSDIVGDTHDVDICGRLEQTLAGCLIDLLFIDAGHGYDDVRHDYELYSPLVRHLVALHDVCHDEDSRPDVRVKGFWEEIIVNGGLPRIVFNRTAERMGIGVLIKEKQ